VTRTDDVRYGAAGVHHSSQDGAPHERDLLMDVYRPDTGDTGVLRPAVVLAHGGAYHRGSKEDDVVEDANEGGLCNTAIAEYCRRLAARGYVCFSIGYRLTGEDPDPGTTPVISDPEAVSRARVDRVRELLELGPATNRMIADGMEAAADDVVTAIVHVREHAKAYGIDPTRIAVGGFSAGATSALYAVLGHRVPTAAVIALSGRLEAADIPLHVIGPDQPPVLHLVAERDLDHVRLLTDALAARYAQVGLSHAVYRVPDAGHFYPRTATAIAPDGRSTTVEAAIFGFLDRHLGTAPAPAPPA
jgi:predicted esterase